MARALVIFPPSGQAIDPRTGYFTPVWQQYMEQLALAVGGSTGDAVSDAVTQAEAAISQAQTAAASASSAGAGKASNAVVGQVFNSASSTRVIAASVPLVGVVAGTLQFDTTSIYSDVATALTGVFYSGTFWITEQLTSGVGPKNDLLTGGITVFKDGGFIEVFINDQATLDAARPAAGILGNVTYRLEVARATGTASLTNALADLRAAQA
jgi:hypothetical protein